MEQIIAQTAAQRWRRYRMDDYVMKSNIAAIIELMFRDAPDNIKYMAVEEIAKLPSVQPETHDKRTETHECDYIINQPNFNAILKTGFEQTLKIVRAEGCKWCASFHTEPWEMPCRECARNYKDCYRRLTNGE